MPNVSFGLNCVIGSYLILNLEDSFLWVTMFWIFIPQNINLLLRQIFVRSDAERKLWSKLRNRQLFDIKFRRQFSMGNYVLDFYSSEYKLAIEADVGQHYEDIGKKKDEIRTRELSKLGIEIIRFSDIDILNNIEGVCEAIVTVIENRKISPSPLSSPQRGEEIILARKQLLKLT